MTENPFKNGDQRCLHPDACQRRSASGICQPCYFRARRIAAGATKWRHRKRGSTYTEIGRGRLQVTDDRFDMVEVVIYRADEDASLWVRPVSEFEDGRFERLDPSAIDQEPAHG